MGSFTPSTWLDLFSLGAGTGCMPRKLPVMAPNPPTVVGPGVCGKFPPRSLRISTLSPTAPAADCWAMGVCQNGVGGTSAEEEGYARHAGVRGVVGSSTSLIVLTLALSIWESSSSLRDSSDPKARASGYVHSYFDTDSIDLASLATFPSDDEIQQATRNAWQEAESLLVLVGIVPTDVIRNSASADTPISTQLPSISSWYPPSQDPLQTCSDIQRHLVIR